MKNIILIAIVCLGGFQAWQKYVNLPEPIFSEPYVVVYGRDACSITRQMISALQDEGVNYHYFIIDEADVTRFIHDRMQASGISTRRYDLPVVDVNGDISVRPKLKDVLSEYRS